MIGMAVNSGNTEKKAELSALLEQAAVLSIGLGLWVEGKPFDMTLRQVSAQLTGGSPVYEATIRVRCTNDLGSVSYLYRRPGDKTVSCALDNGIPAGFSYAGICGDEMGAKFAMESARTSAELATIARELGSPRYSYEPAAS